MFGHLAHVTRVINKNADLGEHEWTIYLQQTSFFHGLCPCTYWECIILSLGMALGICMKPYPYKCVLLSVMYFEPRPLTNC